ncbi:MAG: hypothetical protein ATN36_06120 [Epulopiscium sp. Nele67-Bin005]|nr:MAG: hypothetical protein ATN36_06120 [Epulopiscium sp. Nele67-Bin005]
MSWRSLLSIVSLFIVTKIVGRKELSQMTIFDYITGICIGSIAAQLAVEVDDPWHECLLVMGIFGGVHYLINLVTLKSLFARKFIDGCPIVLMQDGKISAKNLRRSKCDVNMFLEACRLEGYYDLANIHVAIMESSGKISFLSTEEANQNKTLVANVVIDGHIMKNNLKAIKKDEQWLLKKMQLQTVHDVKGMLLVTCDAKEQIVIYNKNEKDIDITHCLE